MAALSVVATVAASLEPVRKQPREPSAEQQAKRAGKLEGFRKRVAAASGEDLGLLRLPVCKPSECRPKWHKLTDDFTGLGQCCRDDLPRRSCCAPAKGAADWSKCADVLPANDCGMRGVLHRSPKGSPRAGFHGVPLFFADEDVKALLHERPPFGYAGSEPRAVRARQRNATVPAVQRFGSCAVVGNSGTLLQRELGAEIDAHDAVIRVNHAPVAHSAAGRRYARWAGSKTTWRVVTSQWFREEKKDPTARILAVCDRGFVYSCQNLLMGNPGHLSVRRLVGKSAIPLSGHVAIAVAQRSCEHVDVYGVSHIGGLASPRDRRRAPPPPAGTKRACGYYYAADPSSGRCASHETNDRYHFGRPGDAAFHDFAAHAEQLLRWNASGAIRIQVRL